MGGELGNKNAAEIKTNWNAKYDSSMEQSILRWIEGVLERPGAFSDVQGKEKFREKFKNGIILCELMNALNPGCIKKINKNPKIAFQQMENVGFANEAIREYGVIAEYVFVTNDLYQGKNLHQVLLCLRNLGDTANKKGFTPKFVL